MIYNTVALCPNCHRKMHILNDKWDLQKLVKKVYEYIGNENEEAQLKEFKKLFKDVI